jgi:hypothetical protein
MKISKNKVNQLFKISYFAFETNFQFQIFLKIGF